MKFEFFFKAFFVYAYNIIQPNTGNVINEVCNNLIEKFQFCASIGEYYDLYFLFSLIFLQ